MLKAIPWLAMIGGGLYFFGKRSMDAVDQLQYTPRGLKVKREGLGLIITVKLAIMNPARQSLFFDRIEASGMWNSSDVGSVVYDKRTIIDAGKETIVDLPFRPNAGGIIKGIVAALTANNPGSITLNGTITAGPLRIPIVSTYQIKKP